MIKAKQYFIENLWKIEFYARTRWWLYQDLGVQYDVKLGRNRNVADPFYAGYNIINIFDLRS